MKKYSLDEGNESLRKILLTMNYDSKSTLKENVKNIFEQVDDNQIDPKLDTPTQETTQQTEPVQQPTPENLSYPDLVKKLQNLLVSKYNANLGSYGVDGKIGGVTLSAIETALKSKQTTPEPVPTEPTNAAPVNAGPDSTVS